MLKKESFKIEKDSGDFPYYAGEPQKLTVAQWMIMVLVLVGQFFIMSNVSLAFLPKIPATVVMDVFLVSVPMLLLWWFTKSTSLALFKPIKGRDVLTIIKYTLLLIVVGIGSTILLKIAGFQTTANAASDQINGVSGYLLLFFDNVLSLFWEELISLIPFLAMMAGLKALGMNRKMNVILSALATSIFFGALHLPSYQWNIPMVFTSIVLLRLVLDLLYLKTKNIWITYVTHLLYDSFVFALPFLITAIAKG